MIEGGVKHMVSILAAGSGRQRTLPGQVRQLLRQGLLAVLLAVAGAAPAVAQAPVLPPVTVPASHEHHVGKLIFVELVTPDLAAAQKFYGGLFGWTFRNLQVSGVEYAQALLDGHPVSGMIRRPLPAWRPRRPSWLGFFSVRDVDATTKIALQHGATQLVAPENVPDRGRQAVLADPQGAVFAILASSSGDLPDVLAELGAWIWSSLITRDPDTDAAFYQALFDYEVFEMPADPGAQHLILASENYARASANTLPPDRPNEHPHWQYLRPCR